MDGLWSKKQVAAERDYRFQERLGILCGSDSVPLNHGSVELAGSEVRDWERLMEFCAATSDQKKGQLSLL